MGVGHILVVLVCAVLSGIIGGFVYQRFGADYGLKVNNTMVTVPLYQTVKSVGREENVLVEPDKYQRFERSLVSFYLLKSA